jgi:transcriptional regulator with XRE-family HTH domain
MFLMHYTAVRLQIGGWVQIPNLRKLRESHGLTQKELADVSGVSLRSVASYEGGAHVRPNTARKLASALETTVEALTKPPSGLEQFFAVHVLELEQIRETVALLAEMVGTPGEWEGISAEEAERRLGYLQRLVSLLGESTETAAEAAREALAIERGDDPKEADEDGAAERNPGVTPGEDRLAALLSTMETTGTG